MYHLCKQSRIYTGEPYCGYTSNGHPASFATLEEAIKGAEIFQSYNPVGWNVYDAKTGQLVYGQDFHC